MIENRDESMESEKQTITIDKAGNSVMICTDGDVLEFEDIKI